MYAVDPIRIDDLQIYPNISEKQVKVVVTLINYMKSNHFNPDKVVGIEMIRDLYQ